jgi:hypothetical protein
LVTGAGKPALRAKITTPGGELLGKPVNHIGQTALIEPDLAQSFVGTTCLTGDYVWQAKNEAAKAVFDRTIAVSER